MNPLCRIFGHRYVLDYGFRMWTCSRFWCKFMAGAEIRER